MNVDPPQRRRIQVVGAALLRDGRVLAARRGPGMSLAGLWEFPGGKIEPGETPQQALARELVEELRCEASIGDLIVTTEHEYEFAVVVLTTFFCTLISGEPQLTEHADIRWVPLAELGGLDWAPADVPAVEALIEFGTRQ